MSQDGCQWHGLPGKRAQYWSSPHNRPELVRAMVSVWQCFFDVTTPV